jgi:Cytochrome P460
MRAVHVKNLAISGIVAATIAYVGYGAMRTTAAGDSSSAAAVVDATGKLRVPQDYRTTYQSFGSWAIAADEGRGSKEVHVVFASPGSIETYRKDGHFPDGTVLVKEVFKTATKELTTGTVSRADQLKGWFVMVRDSAGRYPGNDLWGDGWGWSWFDAADPLKSKSTNYMFECKSCHVPAQATDWVYIDGYPALKR